MIINKTKISGCYEIIPKTFSDERGLFIKPFNQDEFEYYSLETGFKEIYYTKSFKRVLRGLHFQLPPMDHVKIVHCIQGEIMDVVVDLRVNSPTYGSYEIFELNSGKQNMIYIPKGLAHGFYVRSDVAIVLYMVNSVYSPSCDTGILWNSLDIPWPDEHPIISKRDSEFILFKDFKSPFYY